MLCYKFYDKLFLFFGCLAHIQRSPSQPIFVIFWHSALWSWNAGCKMVVFGCCKCFHSLLWFCSLFCPSCRFSHISNERTSHFLSALTMCNVHFILFAPILFFLSFFCSFWLIVYLKFFSLQARHRINSIVCHILSKPFKFFYCSRPFTSYFYSNRKAEIDF